MRSKPAARIILETSPLTRLKVRLISLFMINKKFICWIPIFGYLYLMAKAIMTKDHSKLDELIPTNPVAYWLSSTIHGLAFVVIMLLIK